MKISEAFFKGYARSIDLKTVHSENRKMIDRGLDPSSDFKNLCSDWKKVGDSIGAGIRQYRKCSSK